MTLRTFLAALLAASLLACGGGGGGGGGGGTPAPTPPGTPTLPAADISLLFMGNSHTAANGLPAMVEAMVRAARPGMTVLAVEAPGSMFLQERATDTATLRLLRERTWQAVVLQAQAYSLSGTVNHPTTGAEALVREARAAGALPILFPEWARAGIDETQRVYDIHVAIAAREPACVAPVGQAWDLSLARYPAVVLHAPDGNHSAPAGAFLAALVIAATYPRVSPAQVPFLAGFGVDEPTQARLREVAADTVAQHDPRQHCPADN
jgi:hypothetical protein